MRLTAGELCALVGGTLLQGSAETQLEHIALDSRSMLGRDLFVPVRGERVDGHRFIGGAFAAGAAASLTADASAYDGAGTLILVEDTAAALQRLGARLRERFTGPVVGVTGSVGKTTTRELTKAALSAGGLVTGNEKNMNSQLGLPVTLAHMDYAAERAVLEMGISIPGEMKRLVAMGRPTLALVTNIGVAHIETMGSREAICEEKMHITDSLGPEGFAVLNGEEPLLLAYRGTKAFRPVYYGLSEACEVYAEDLRLEGETSFTAVFRETPWFPARRLPVRLSVLGAHNVMNALAALTAAVLLGVDPAAAAGRLAGYGGFHRRLERLTVEGRSIIDDSYNANPVSMKAALDVLGLAAAAPGTRRAAVLADMLELGPDEAALHREVTDYAAALPVDLYILYGPLMTAAAAGLTAAGRPVLLAEGPEEAARLVRQHTLPGDTVLLKGSNGMKLDRVLDALKAAEP